MDIIHVLPDHSDVPIALTIGNFDGVHVGHQEMLFILRRRADLLGIPASVLTFEPHPLQFVSPARAPRRLTDPAQKALLLEGAGVDRLYVCAFDANLANTPAEDFVSRVLVGRLNMRHLLIGDDFRFGAARRGDLALLKRMAPALGFEVEAMPTVKSDGERISSTAVRRARDDGNYARMAALLGRAAIC